MIGWANHQTVTRDTALKLKESLAWIGRQPVGIVSATMGMESGWRLIHPKVRKRGRRGRKGGANSLIVGRQVEGLTEGSARQVISWLTSRSRGSPFLEGLGRITRKKEGEEKAIVLNSDQIDKKRVWGKTRVSQQRNSCEFEKKLLMEQLRKKRQSSRGILFLWFQLNPN